MTEAEYHSAAALRDKSART